MQYKNHSFKIFAILNSTRFNSSILYIYWYIVAVKFSFN